MFELAVPAAVEFKSPRACAFALLGLQEYLDSFPGDRAALGASDALANRLLNSYRAHHSRDWKWFENVLAYSNARLPQALIRAGMRANNEEMLSAGLEALDWLVTIQRCEVKGHFVPSALRASIPKIQRRLALTSSRWRLAGPSRPACRRTARQARAAGAKRRGPLSIGFWETTTFRSLFTIRLLAVVEMVCIPTAQMKIKGLSPRCLF